MLYIFEGVQGIACQLVSKVPCVLFDFVAFPASSYVSAVVSSDVFRLTLRTADCRVFQTRTHSAVSFSVRA